MTETRSWLLHATERCPRCEQLYAYELEVHCVRCDLPICPFCVVRVRGEPTCGTHDGAEEDR
ncbi:MAG TPA: hypothetical protein RMH99_18090 [Sandaracinaceae bacterium LLY-WYZ-13_1]|nr:hypothetical protein [Sandaracinaceae bacterium LLY-WYZ-13_1]